MNNDALDKLRLAWSEVAKERVWDPGNFHEELRRKWEIRSRRIVAKILIEISICLVIYASAISVILRADATYSSQLFGIKIILLSLIFFAPVGVSLYQSLIAFRKIDLTQPVKHYLEDSVMKLTRTIKLYERYSFLFSGFMAVMLLTDSFFMSQPAWMKILAFSFVVLGALMVRPYLRIVYGKDIRRFMALKEELAPLDPE